MTSNGSSITSGAYNIVVGRLNIGHTYSLIDIGMHSFAHTGYVMSVHQTEIQRHYTTI